MSEAEKQAVIEGQEGGQGNGQVSSEQTSGDVSAEQTNLPAVSESDGAPSSTEPPVQTPAVETPPSQPAIEAPSLPVDPTASVITGSLAQSSVSSSVNSNGTAVQQPIVQGSVVQGLVPPGPGTAVDQVVSSTPPNIPPTPAPTPAPAPAPIPVKEPEVVLPVVQTGITDVDKAIDGYMQHAGLEAKMIIQTIREYIVKMKPGKPIAVKDGTMAQVGFYNAIVNAINNLEGDFRPTMNSILALMHAHRDGAFRETHVFRFVEHLPLSAEHRKGFQKVTTLLKTLANPGTRQQLLHQIHFDNVTKYGLTERGRTKLAAFFGK